MAGVRQYLGQMRAAEADIARSMGVDLRGTSKELRVAILAVTAMVAVLMRALYLAGVLTDEQIQAALDDARADIYGDEPVNPPPTL